MGYLGNLFIVKEVFIKEIPLPLYSLFLLSDLLQSLLNWGKSLGLLNCLIPSSSSSNFPILQYVDNTLLIMEVIQKHVLFFKSLLHTYEMTLGLRVNYAKSSIIPINVDAEK
jgi:hypothetical protein